MANIKKSISNTYTRKFCIKLRRIKWPPPASVQQRLKNINNPLHGYQAETKSSTRRLSKTNHTIEEASGNSRVNFPSKIKINTQKHSNATFAKKVVCAIAKNNTLKPVVEENEQEADILAISDNARNKNYAGHEEDIEHLLNNIDRKLEEVEKEKNNVQQIDKRFLPSRKGHISSRMRLSKVYDFSQEATIEDHDPTKDIVSELIKEGKVRVARCAKGKGKPTLKRRPQIKKTAKKLKTHEPVQDVPTPVHENISLHEHNKDADNNTHDDDNDKFSERAETPLMDRSLPGSPIRTPVHGDSTFSDLARTVLLHQHQTGKTYSHKKYDMNKTELVSAVRKFVSTPINSKAATTPELRSINFSAINLPGSTPYHHNEGLASPWRVEKYNNLPAVFNFSCNTSNLPSFSCDYIPPTEHTESSNNNAQHSNKNPSLSSTSSTNDSNAENVAPHAATLMSTHNNNNNYNENLLNLRQQANPIYGRTHRSPLKAINIIEVVQLPPWKTMENDKNTISLTSPITTKLSTDKVLNNNSNSTKIRSTSDRTKNKQDLFGFEEFIDDDSDDAVDEDSYNSNNSSNPNSTLYQKLKQLNKWRPNIIQKPENNRKKSEVTNLFAGYDGKDKKQRYVNEMLCSTMINANAGAPRDRQLVTSKTKHQEEENVNLFHENSVENSFNDNSAHRTYIRPYKRKRKLRQNLVMYMDSDESGEDECAELQIQDLHKRKYQRKEKTVETELNQFVQEFNSMCNEVQRFDLMVEKEV